MYQLGVGGFGGEHREGRRQSFLLARQPPAAERRTDPRFGAVGVGHARREDGRTVGRADADRHPADGLRKGQPLQARSVPAAVRLPGADDLGRAALLDQRAAAAAVLHEQRLHAAAGRAARAEAAGGARQPRRASPRRTATIFGREPQRDRDHRRRSSTSPPNRCAPTKSARRPTRAKKKEIEADPKKAPKPKRQADGGRHADGRHDGGRHAGRPGRRMRRRSRCR